MLPFVAAAQPNLPPDTAKAYVSTDGVLLDTLDQPELWKNKHDFYNAIPYDLIDFGRVAPQQVVYRVLVTPNGGLLKYGLAECKDTSLLQYIKPRITTMKFARPTRKGKPVYAWFDIKIPFSPTVKTCIASGKTEQAPKAKNLDEVRSNIDYPSHLRNAMVQGDVVVRTLYDASGAYVRHIVVRSPHDELTDGVVQHLPSLQYTPAREYGVPVSCWVVNTFYFNLK